MKKVFSLAFILFFAISAWTQTTYTWNQPGGGVWTTAGNWTPNRTSPAANDILVFGNGTTFIVTGVPTQTIGKLQVTGNTNATLQAVNSGTPTVTVSTAASDAIDVDAGSTLQIQGVRQSGNDYSLTLTTTNTVALQANIDGTVIVKLQNTTRPATLGVFTKGGANATINFNSGSLYTHNVDGSLIPTSTWNSTSTCNITGLTATVPSGLSQSFGHFTYDCPDHAALINFNSALTSVAGNFTVKFAGEEQGVRTVNGLALSSNTDFTLTVGGNFVVDHYSTEATWLMLTTGIANVTVNVAGDFNMSNSGGSGSCFFDFKQNAATTMGVLVMNIAGNFTQTGGYFDWTFQTNGGSNFTTINLTGNFSFTGSSIMITSTTNGTTPNGKLFFNKAGTQTVTVTTPGFLVYTNFEVLSGSIVELLSTINIQSDANAPWGGKFIVNSGATLDANTFQIASSSGLTVGSNNAFTLNSGASIITANVNGVHQIGFAGPTISAAIASRIFSSEANYTYDGIANQVSGTFVTTPTANQVNNLTVNNSAGRYTTGVTLQQPIAVVTACIFTEGVITSSAVNLLTFNAGSSAVGANNNSNPSFVHGPVLKKGSTDFEFPVGHTATGMIPIAISGLSESSDFLAEYKRIPASSLGPCTAPGLDHVSRCEYWQLDRTGAATANVTLYWNNFSNCNFPAHIQDPQLFTLYVAHFDGTSWDTYGRNSLTGNPGSGTVTWNSIATFSPFALGTTDPENIPLKVKLSDIKAYQLGNNIKVDWTNLTESDVTNYTVERSGNGIEFTAVGQQLPRSNSNDRQDYSLLDQTPLNGANFYRIRVLEQNGRITYSKVVKVEMGTSFSNELIIYPNPVTDKQVSVNINGWEKGQYTIRIFNSSGQLVFGRTINHTGGSMTEIIQLPAFIGPGYYSMLIGNEKISRNKPIIVQ